MRWPQFVYVLTAFDSIASAGRWKLEPGSVQYGPLGSPYVPQDEEVCPFLTVNIGAFCTSPRADQRSFHYTCRFAHLDGTFLKMKRVHKVKFECPFRYVCVKHTRRGQQAGESDFEEAQTCGPEPSTSAGASGRAPGLKKTVWRGWHPSQGEETRPAIDCIHADHVDGERGELKEKRLAIKLLKARDRRARARNEKLQAKRAKVYEEQHRLQVELDVRIGTRQEPNQAAAPDLAAEIVDAIRVVRRPRGRPGRRARTTSGSSVASTSGSAAIRHEAAGPRPTFPTLHVANQASDAASHTVPAESIGSAVQVVNLPIADVDIFGDIADLFDLPPATTGSCTDRASATDQRGH